MVCTKHFQFLYNLREYIIFTTPTVSTVYVSKNVTCKTNKPPLFSTIEKARLAHLIGSVICCRKAARKSSAMICLKGLKQLWSSFIMLLLFIIVHVLYKINNRLTASSNKWERLHFYTGTFLEWSTDWHDTAGTVMSFGKLDNPFTTKCTGRRIRPPYTFFMYIKSRDLVIFLCCIFWQCVTAGTALYA